VPGLSAIVLSFNRRDALRSTLRHLLDTPAIDEIIVVDNASSDSSADAARDLLGTRGRVIALSSNTGVAAFNTAAAAATGDLLLILDDDSWPDPASLDHAIAALHADPRAAAVALSPKHPRTLHLEWPHAHSPSDTFPMMGCGNLVRAEAWSHAGGYEPSYFLYRNDADLALTLLGLGRRVLFHPQWIVWHDSPAAASKSDRWLRLATRNWVWMARRHGRGFWKWAGILLGFAKAMIHAGQDSARTQLVADGLREGLYSAPPPCPARPNGRWWRDLVLTQLRRH
jgi:GT2 family glycosyltransferase